MISIHNTAKRIKTIKANISVIDVQIQNLFFISCNLS